MNSPFGDLTPMEATSLCQDNEQTRAIKEKITAEHGFKRFSKNTYRPVTEQYLFGHAVRVVELKPQMNKLYVAGNPSEFEHHFRQVIPEITCIKHSCQAPINDLQTLHIYKAKTRKSKDTTVVECTHP